MSSSTAGSRRTPLLLLIVAAIAVAAIAYAVTARADGSDDAAGGGDPSASGAPNGAGDAGDPLASATSFPDLAAPTGDPGLPGLEDAAPASAGTVGTVEGPFDDRFRWQGLRLAGAKVSGAVDITSDVSDLLELQVLAGFYDRDGRLLATARFTHHATGDEEHTGPPSENEPFTITAPAAVRAKVASAAVGVTSLVNE